MSCFIVDAAHIDVLVNAAAEYGLDLPASPAELGNLLLTENRASYRHRYAHRLDDTDLDALQHRYRLRTIDAPLHPYAVVKAVQCYAYQSCAHPGWPTSVAKTFCDRLTVHAEQGLSVEERVLVRRFDGRLVPRYQFSDVFGRMPWGFSDLADATCARWGRPGANR